jgi:dephospho-CoA kinase
VQPRVRRVALTGGIATGKSTCLGRFAALGVPVIDSDVLAREAVAPGTPGLAAVAARFGPAVLATDGSLDRGRLAEIVFADPRARIDLEAIVHPFVFDRIVEWFDRQPRTGFAIADVPLLYEAGHAGDFDVVIVAACSPDEQLARVIARDGLSEADARRRIASQWPIERKRALADYVVDTSGSVEETVRRVDEIVRALGSGL